MVAVIVWTVTLAAAVICVVEAYAYISEELDDDPYRSWR